MILAVAATVVFHDAWKIKLNGFVKRLFEKENKRYFNHWLIKTLAVHRTCFQRRLNF